MGTRIDELKGYLLAGMSHGVSMSSRDMAGLAERDHTAAEWWDEGYEIGLMMRRWRQGAMLEVGIKNMLDHRVNEIGLARTEVE